ncbi:MAG: 50S ribosomal protein L34e [Nanoarchaeota archaeon]|nr:50S ribosomal protein L34e [Nanoarchaeota archaeon]
MVRRALRSRSLRRIKVKVPGGRVVTHYKRRKPSPAKCGGCGAVLKGIARERPRKMQNIPKTRKRPQRPYGGVLCSKCARVLLKEKVKSLG